MEDLSKYTLPDSREGRTPRDVAHYYEEWTSRYLDVYGEIIQAYRPDSDEELINYLIQNSGLDRAEHALDAGCGVGGPAIAFAKRLPNLRIHGVTNSQVQVEEARKRVSAAGLNDRISITLGDYHELDTLLPQESYDFAYFTESFGHSLDRQRLLSGLWRVLKPGARVYIKDIFRREPTTERESVIMQFWIDMINRDYCYNVPELCPTLTTLRRIGYWLHYVKGTSFLNDYHKVAKEFQYRFGLIIDADIAIHHGLEFVFPIDFMELKFQKPWDSNPEPAFWEERL